MVVVVVAADEDVVWPIVVAEGDVEITVGRVIVVIVEGTVAFESWKIAEKSRNIETFARMIKSMRVRIKRKI